MSKKNQKMSLSAFMADQSLGAWADEIADLPVASASSTNYESKASAAKWSKNVQLPTSPPYLLYMGNLDFNVTERDLNIFFGDLEIKSIRIIRDANDNPKGFGYVEFEELQGLKDALLLNNESLMGRKVRLDVAEQSADKKSFRSDRTAETSSWRREGAPVETGNSKNQRYDKTEGASNWRRDGPPPEITRQRQGQGEQRTFRDHSTDKGSNWRRDGPPPEIMGDKSGGFEKKSFRSDKTDGESNWRRDGPLPDFSQNKQSHKSSDSTRKPGNDKTGNVSNWRREGPVETRNEKTPAYQKKFDKVEKATHKSIADSADVWRKSGDAPAPQAFRAFKGMKHENSSASIKNVKVSRVETETENMDSKASHTQGKGATTSVSTKNAFGCLSNVSLLN